MNGLKKAGVVLDRKVLADMAVNDPTAFAAWWKLRKKLWLNLLRSKERTKKGPFGVLFRWGVRAGAKRFGRRA